MAGSSGSEHGLPDWTVNLHSSRRNTSPLFTEVCDQVEAILCNLVAEYEAGRTSDIAEAIVAFLAHHSPEVQLVPVE